MSAPNFVNFLKLVIGTQTGTGDTAVLTITTGMPSNLTDNSWVGTTLRVIDPTDDTVLELVKVTANTSDSLTVSRHAEGAGTKVTSLNGLTLTNVLTKDSLSLLEGTIKYNLNPNSEGLLDIGDSTHHLRKVWTHELQMKGVNIRRATGNTGTVNLTLPTTDGRILTTADNSQSEPGCFEGMVCMESDGSDLGADYKLMGGSRGNVVILTKAGDTGDWEMLAQKRAYLRQIFPNSITWGGGEWTDGSTSFDITNLGTTNIANMNFTEEDTTTGKWATLNFNNPSFTREQFIGFIKTRPLGSANDHDPGGSLAVMGNLYVGGKVDFQDTVNVPKINIAGHVGARVIAGAAAPTTAANEAAGYLLGDLWCHGGNAWTFVGDNDSDEGQWKQSTNVAPPEDSWLKIYQFGGGVLSAGWKTLTIGGGVTFNDLSEIIVYPPPTQTDYGATPINVDYLKTLTKSSYLKLQPRCRIAYSSNTALFFYMEQDSNDVHTYYRQDQIWGKRK